jgi:hypothetical protein
MKALTAEKLTVRQLAWSPPQQHLFRSLWTAAAASNDRAWIEDVGAA